MNPGRYTDLSNEQYHAAPGVSSSLLKAFASANTPLHFYTDYVEKKAVSDELQKSFDIGSAVHAGLLEPDVFDEKFVVFNDADIVFKIGGKNPRATNDYKAWKEHFMAENAGKCLLTGNDAAQVNGMVKSLRGDHAYVQKIMVGGHAEHSFFFHYSYSPLLCKCRPDYLREDGYIVDLKTTDDASEAAFSKQIANLGYHIQAAHYLDGVRAVVGEAKQFIFVAVEKKPPYGVAVHVADADMLNIGSGDAQLALVEYGRCLETDEWPCYPQSAQFISMPGWAK